MTVERYKDIQLAVCKKKKPHGLKRKRANGKIEYFCARCIYGNWGYTRREDNPRDLVDDNNRKMGLKLLDGFSLMHSNE